MRCLFIHEHLDITSIITELLCTRDEKTDVYICVVKEVEVDIPILQSSLKAVQERNSEKLATGIQKATDN